MAYNIVVPPPVRKRKGPKKPRLFSMGTQALPNPYPVGQKLTVYVNNGMDFLPCFPKPGAVGKEILTRIPNKSVVIYKGYVETTNGVKVMSVSYNDIEVYVGTGATKFLVPRRIRKKVNRRYK